MDLKQLQDRLDAKRQGGVRAGTVLEWDLSEPPGEPGPSSPLTSLQHAVRRTLDVRTAIAAIDRAAADDRITGLVARIGFHAAPLSVCQELRGAIARFRAAGKSTAAYSETLPGVAAWYVAAAFERIVVLPAGQVGVVGLASATTFLGEALPAAGIEPEFLQRHEYKNMANMFTETDYTAAHREAVEAVQASALGSVVADVAADRGLEPDAVRDAIATGPHAAPDAVALGLIDDVGFADEVWDGVAPGETPLQFLERYEHHTKPKRAKGRNKRPVVAVIPVTGTIASGRSGGLKPGLPPGPGTGADTFVAAVRAAVADDVVAVIVRVDSPGGSAIASEVMARAVDVGRQAGTPFVASMASVAASGGYYVSAPCDRIVANPSTITGSIGVVSGKMVTAGLRDRLHLATRVIETSDNASILSSLRPWSTEERAVMDAEIDRTYELFLGRVADGRAMTPEQVHEVAKGRVWTGVDAHQRGLVDVLGGFAEALGEARHLAGLASGAEVDVVSYPRTGPLDLLAKPESSRPAARAPGAPVVPSPAPLVGAAAAYVLREAARGLIRLADGVTVSTDPVRTELPGDWVLR